MMTLLTVLRWGHLRHNQSREVMEGMMMTAAVKRSFEEWVAYHLHNVIQHDLDELLQDPPSLASSHVTDRIVSSSSSLDSSVVSSKICEVQFKYLHRHYFLPESLNHIQIGEFAIVQSFLDKFQEDLGVVTKIYDRDEFECFHLLEGPHEDADENRVGIILRIATQFERRCLPIKFQREGPLLGTCRSFLRNTLTPMNVYGVEYQLDGRVLYVYYLSDLRVDFRPLVRVLCRILFKNVRVQMKKTNRCRQFIPIPSASEALVTGQHCFPI